MRELQPETYRIVRAIVSEAAWLEIEGLTSLDALRDLYDGLSAYEIDECRYSSSISLSGSGVRQERCTVGKRLTANHVLQRFCDLAKGDGLDTHLQARETDFWINPTLMYLDDRKWNGTDAEIWVEIMAEGKEHNWTQWDNYDPAFAASKDRLGIGLHNPNDLTPYGRGRFI